jgi:hypothetical protein
MRHEPLKKSRHGNPLPPEEHGVALEVYRRGKMEARNDVTGSAQQD